MARLNLGHWSFRFGQREAKGGKRVRMRFVLHQRELSEERKRGDEVLWRNDKEKEGAPQELEFQAWRGCIVLGIGAHLWRRHTWSY